MGLRGRAKRLERDARGELESFELLDGSRYYYVSGSELYRHCWACLEAGHPENWPTPPEVLLKLCEAKDVRVAFEAVMDGSTDSFAYDDIFPYDPEILVNERRLEPRSLVAGRDLHDQEVEDLSE